MIHRSGIGYPGKPFLTLSKDLRGQNYGKSGQPDFKSKKYTMKTLIKTKH